jgi:hypothetical protein
MGMMSISYRILPENQKGKKPLRLIYGDNIRTDLKEIV